MLYTNYLRITKILLQNKTETDYFAKKKTDNCIYMRSRYRLAAREVLGKQKKHCKLQHNNNKGYFKRPISLCA